MERGLSALGQLEGGVEKSGRCISYYNGSGNLLGHISAYLFETLPTNHHQIHNVKTLIVNLKSVVIGSN